MKITDEGALLLRVNRHKHRWNGEVCDKPISHECGMNPGYRRNVCAKGSKECFDINLFHDTNPLLIKKVSDEVKPLFDKQIELLDKGFNPIIFLYTFGSSRNDSKQPIIGAYVVKSIMVESNGFGKDDYYIYPEEIVKVPPNLLSNEYLFERSTYAPGNENILWCREVYQSAMFPFLDNMASILQNNGKGEYEASGQKLFALLENINTASLKCGCLSFLTGS